MHRNRKLCCASMSLMLLVFCGSDVKGYEIFYPVQVDFKESDVLHASIVKSKIECLLKCAIRPGCNHIETGEMNVQMLRCIMIKEVNSHTLLTVDEKRPILSKFLGKGELNDRKTAYAIQFSETYADNSFYPSVTFQFPAGMTGTTTCSWFRFNVDRSGENMIFIIHPTRPDGKNKLLCNYPTVGFTKTSTSQILLWDEAGRVHSRQHSLKGKWHHLCVVRTKLSDERSEYKIYLDSNSIASMTVNEFLYTPNRDFDIQIGNDRDPRKLNGEDRCLSTDASQGFIGDLYGTTVWNRSLSEDMIRSVFTDQELFEEYKIVSWDQFLAALRPSNTAVRKYEIDKSVLRN